MFPTNNSTSAARFPMLAGSPDLEVLPGSLDFRQAFSRIFLAVQLVGPYKPGLSLSGLSLVPTKSLGCMPTVRTPEAPQTTCHDAY